MTNIDHDALARRIAKTIALNSVLPHARLPTWECIARELREALPTSEDEKGRLVDDVMMKLDRDRKESSGDE